MFRRIHIYCLFFQVTTKKPFVVFFLNKKCNHFPVCLTPLIIFENFSSSHSFYYLENIYLTYSMLLRRYVLCCFFNFRSFYRNSKEFINSFAIQILSKVLVLWPIFLIRLICIFFCGRINFSTEFLMFCWKYILAVK